jgi:hypothetical protein
LGLYPGYTKNIDTTVCQMFELTVCASMEIQTYRSKGTDATVLQTARLDATSPQKLLENRDLGVIKESNSRPRQMSLNFIAPGSIATSEDIKGRFNKSVLLPLITEILPQNYLCSKPTLPRIAEMNRPAVMRRQRCTPYPVSHRASYSPPPSSPSVGSTSSRSRSISPVFSSRAERHEYDPEERFAVVYLRIMAGQSQWKDIKSAFDVIFPPGQPRRMIAPTATNSKALPQFYPERSVGGLECRYYRIRELEGMKKVREGRRDCGAQLEHDALLRMQNDLVRCWLESLDTQRRGDLDLTQGLSESVEDWVTRGKAPYKSHSEFWQLLMAHAVFGC